MLSRVARTAFAVLIIASSSIGSASADYTTAQIFETRRDEAPGFSRQRIGFGEPLFSFSTLLADDLVVETADAASGADEPAIRIRAAEGGDNFAIEIHRIGFPAFAEAQIAGYAFLGMRGYERVLQDFDNSNAALGHLAGATLRADGSYNRMARLVTVSRGRDVLFVYAAFDYDDYPVYRETLSRFLGAIEMDEPGAPMEALEMIEAAGGERLAVSPDWTTIEADTEGEGRSDYALSLGDQEYPNLFVTIRPIALEDARQLGVGIIGDYTEQVEASPLAKFAGDAEMETELDGDGAPLAYAYARGVLTVDGALLVSMFRIQTNHDAASSAIIGLNGFDARRGAEGFDAEIRDLIFKGWVAGSSAYAMLARSLHRGIEHLETDLDIRSLGH